METEIQMKHEKILELSSIFNSLPEKALIDKGLVLIELKKFFDSANSLCIWARQELGIAHTNFHICMSAAKKFPTYKGVNFIAKPLMVLCYRKTPESVSRIVLDLFKKGTEVKTRFVEDLIKQHNRGECFKGFEEKKDHCVPEKHNGLFPSKKRHTVTDAFDFARMANVQLDRIQSYDPQAIPALEWVIQRSQLKINLMTKGV